MKKQILFISQTAIMLALLIVMQLFTRGMSQFVTGTLVNTTLLITTFVIGLPAGIIIGLLSPLLAFMIGIGPAFIQIVIFVALANVIFVTVSWFLAKNTVLLNELSKRIKTVVALVIASVAKTTFLWLGLVKLALPLIPGLKEQQIAIISVSFSWPQLVTALLGSALAIIAVPLVKRAVK